MAQNKTQKTKQSVTAFLNSVDDAVRRRDAKRVCAMMRDITGKKPAMWGTSIVGFGDYHYRYESGREGDFFHIGFSPRKQNLTIYIMPGYQGFETLLEQLGPHKIGKSCLYIKNLDEVDQSVLRRILKKGYQGALSLQ